MDDQQVLELVATKHTKLEAPSQAGPESSNRRQGPTTPEQEHPQVTGNQALQVPEMQHQQNPTGWHKTLWTENEGTPPQEHQEQQDALHLVFRGQQQPDRVQEPPGQQLVESGDATSQELGV